MSKKPFDGDPILPEIEDPTPASHVASSKAAQAVEPGGQGGRYIRDPQTGERVLVERTAV